MTAEVQLRPMTRFRKVVPHEVRVLAFSVPSFIFHSSVQQFHRAPSKCQTLFRSVEKIMTNEMERAPVLMERSVES